ncbi:MAG: hypothetical protein J0M26_13290 [Planctomycetes bacterium]|nr:hypothetical protein [Planctomycetota bacterium]
MRSASYRPQLLTCLFWTVISCVGCYTTEPPADFAQGSHTSWTVPVKYSGTEKGTVLQRLMNVGLQRSEIILGQNIGATCNSIADLEREIEKLEELSDDRKRPMLIGIDYGWGDMNADEIRKANKILIDHWNRGGLITINFDPGNPVTGKPDPNDTTRVDLRRVTLPGTEENRHFSRQLRIVATGLRELQRHGVVVLWRPIHEPNGGWFWWCSHDESTDEWTSPEHYRLFWEYIHRELTVGYGLNNLVWVYSPASMAYSAIRPTDMYYPGDDYVDMIGIDLYTDSFTRESFNAQNGFTSLRKFNKPLAISEMGSHRLDGSFNAHHALDAIFDYCPDAKYVLFWHSWNDGPKRLPMALVDCIDADKVMNDPRALTLSPQFRSESTGTSTDKEALIQRFIDHGINH